MDRLVTGVLDTSLTRYIGGEEKWFVTFVGNEEGKSRDPYIAHVTEYYKTITGMGDMTVRHNWAVSFEI